MQIIEKRPEDLIPYENNPRINDGAVKYVGESIKQFGFKNPIIIDKNNVIVAGHTRQKASLLLNIPLVPCIIADDLTEDQIRAFRLADNKVAEYAEWDIDLLNLELGEIEGLEPLEFGFEVKEEFEEEIKVNERERTINTYNLDIYDENSTEGFYQMPIIKNDNFIPTQIIGFNYAKTSKDKNTGIHFYLDDYQFERIWNDPEKYIDILQQYECIFSPDFSLYMDMPMAMKIWNIYRSRSIGQYYQQNGIKVIPTISWAEEDTFSFCFDGIEKGSIVSVSTIGVKRNEDAYNIWKNGMDEMIKRIQPKTIIVYGGELEYDYKDIEVVYFDNNIKERIK